MRIPFDIKHRNKIESGEYKVETKDGREVRIVCWDVKSSCSKEHNDILALVESKGGAENALFYAQNGYCLSDSSRVGRKDLFIVTPEPEMSEMEISLLSWLSDDTSGEIPMERMKQVVKARAAELLATAKKQLLQSGELLTQEHHEKLMETLREECKKDLPRWRNVEADKRYVGCVTRYMDVNGDWNYCMSSGKLSDDCQYISIAALEKLPKEDSHE